MLNSPFYWLLIRFNTFKKPAIDHQEYICQRHMLGSIKLLALTMHLLKSTVIWSVRYTHYKPFDLLFCVHGLVTNIVAETL